MARSPIRLSVKLRGPGLSGYLKKVQGADARVSETTAHQIRAQAERYAPKKTTSLAQSLYVSTHTKSDYGARAGAARRVNPAARILPEVPKPQRRGAAVVASAVEHAQYVELGTARMAPRPFLSQAAEEARRPFRDALAKELKDAAK